MEQVLDSLTSLSGTFIAIMVVAGLYFVTQRFILGRIKQGSKYAWIRNVILAAIVFLGVILVVSSLPISDDLKGQLLSLVGIVLSAAIALSSTTLLGNALAAVMIRLVNPFQVGDFIRGSEYFGRVTNRGVFHTEIQSEDRDLMTIPNLIIASNPLKVIRKTGTIISASCSLGYDVRRDKIEEALIQAATNTGLKDPFVFVTELGDFSIVYKVHGLLEKVETIISTQSKLKKCMLDSLHAAGIEIVSPTFMNQRQVNDQIFIPRGRVRDDGQEPDVEKILFEKADTAKKLEEQQQMLADVQEKLAGLEKEKKDAADSSVIQAKITSYIRLKERLEQRMKDQKEKLDGE